MSSSAKAIHKYYTKGLLSLHSASIGRNKKQASRVKPGISTNVFDCNYLIGANPHFSANDQKREWFACHVCLMRVYLVGCHSMAGCRYGEN
jgi:hypothetical protein